MGLNFVFFFFFKKADPKNILFKKRILMNLFFKFCVIGGEDSMFLGSQEFTFIVFSTVSLDHRVL